MATGRVDGKGRAGPTSVACHSENVDTPSSFPLLVPWTLTLGYLDSVVLGSCELGRPSVACLKVNVLSEAANHSYQVHGLNGMGQP